MENWSTKATETHTRYGTCTSTRIGHFGHRPTILHTIVPQTMRISNEARKIFQAKLNESEEKIRDKICEKDP
jgi:hypothetical protein